MLRRGGDERGFGEGEVMSVGLGGGKGRGKGWGRGSGEEGRDCSTRVKGRWFDDSTGIPMQWRSREWYGNLTAEEEYCRQECWQRLGEGVSRHWGREN